MRPRDVGISVNSLQVTDHFSDIRTYAVVPLNEECGLIEWVPLTVTIRSIFQKYYNQRNIVITSSKVNEWRDHVASPDASKVDVYFEKELLKP